MSDSVPDSEEMRARRLELAKKAFRDFNAQCFWWYPLDFEVTEAAIPMIVRELRAAGGHEGYRIVAELCR
jgi:hypothetical protein